MVHPKRAIAVGLWWLTREIELSNIILKDVSILSATEAGILLPASKSDPTAVGVFRSQCCCCADSGAPVPAIGCPRCILVRQHAWVRESFGDGLTEAEISALPLFPSSTGAFCSKAATVATIVAAAVKLGLQAEAHTGAQAFGGHALRRGGAQGLASWGIDIWRIQCLARHSSAAILRYVGDAHVVSLGTLASEAVAGTSLDRIRLELRALAADAREAAVAARIREPAASPSAPLVPLPVAAVLPELAPPPATVVVAQPVDSHPFVWSGRPGGKVHIRSPEVPSMALCTWNWAASALAQPCQMRWGPSKVSPRFMCDRCVDKELLAACPSSAWATKARGNCAHT